MQILAATDLSTRSNRAVRQAGLFAQALNADLTLLHVVDDDRSPDLVSVEQREAEKILREQSGSMPELRGTKCQPTVVTGDPFAEILRVAAAVGADLLVLGSHRKQLLLDVFVGTTVERVVRGSSVPVLVVSNEAQREYLSAIAPVEFSDLSAHAIRAARSLHLVSDDRLTLLHAYQPSDRSAPSGETAEHSADRMRAQDDLARFLIANSLHLDGSFLEVDEGTPMEVIVKAVKNKNADLLVMGVRGRHPLFRALFGSVTAEALGSLVVDILAVPLDAQRKDARV